MLQLNYPEFDGFSEALQGVQGQYVLRAKQQHDWRLRILELHGVTLMAGRDGAANIYSGACTPGSFTAFLPLRAHSSIVVNGRRFDRETIAWLAPDQMFHIGADVPTSWLSVTVSAALIDSWLRAHERNAEELALAGSFTGIAGTSVGALISLAHRLFVVGARSPHDLQRGAMRESARREVVNATLRTLLPINRSRQAGRPAIDRSKILFQALGLIEAVVDEPVYTEDMCRTTEVSERTLRNVFHETFGMTPHQYLLLVRLNRARVAIRSAHPGQTLASICADLGFWDFGQFAKCYRRVFGVLPSQTLSERRRLIAN